MIVRRRLPPDVREAFDAFIGVVGHVERAKTALTASVPSTRYAGRPLVDTISEFETELETAAAILTPWGIPALEGAWSACHDAIAHARRLAERLRLEAPDPGGFEGLIGLIGDLMAPLEAFGAAAEAFARLRTRRGDATR